MNGALISRGQRLRRPDHAELAELSTRELSTSPREIREGFGVVAAEALAASVSIFELSRLMGTSVATIDRYYGHLVRDAEGSIRARLDPRTRRLGVDQASATKGKTDE